MALSSLSRAGALYRRVLARQSYPSGWAERSPVDQSNSNGSRGKHVGSAAGPARLLISIATRFRDMPGSRFLSDCEIFLSVYDRHALRLLG
jgi:hypothetical protein